MRVNHLGVQLQELGKQHWSHLKKEEQDTGCKKKSMKQERKKPDRIEQGEKINKANTPLLITEKQQSTSLGIKKET